MVHKLVNLSLDAYNALKKAKKKDESFSKVVLRNFTHKKKNIWDSFGVLTEKEAAILEKGSKDLRKAAKVREW